MTCECSQSQMFKKLAPGAFAAHPPFWIGLGKGDLNPCPHKTQSEKRSKLGCIKPHCNNRTVHTACTKQHAMQCVSKLDLAPFFRVASGFVHCGWGLRKSIQEHTTLSLVERDGSGFPWHKELLRRWGDPESGNTGWKFSLFCQRHALLTRFGIFEVTY